MTPARPPTLLISVALEGRPSVSLDCATAGEELRLRDYLAANLARIVERITAALERVTVPRDPKLAAALELALRIGVQGETTVGELCAGAAAGEPAARAWVAWVYRALEPPDARFAAVLLILMHLYPGLLAELEAVLGGGP